jgi:hypothetical protein
MKRSTIIPITLGLIIIGGLAHALGKKKQAKEPQPRKIPSEQRKLKRLNLYAHALVKKEGTTFVSSGEIVNISNMGVYLTTNGLFNIDDLLELTIYFQHSTRKLSMTVPCKVARIDEKGFGLKSSHIDTNMLQYLELMFDLNKENTKQLIEELFKII